MKCFAVLAVYRIMKTLNLGKLWQICNKLSEKQDILSEESIYVSLLGNRSSYCDPTFNSFLEYYSFKVEKEGITVFNDDGVPWEDYNVGDFSYIASELLDMSEEDLNVWIEAEVVRQLESQRVNKLAEKDKIREQIRQLTKQLEL